MKYALVHTENVGIEVEVRNTYLYDKKANKEIDSKAMLELGKTCKRNNCYLELIWFGSKEPMPKVTSLAAWDPVDFERLKPQGVRDQIVKLINSGAKKLEDLPKGFFD